MKFIVSVLLTGLFAFALGGFLPWWSIAIAGFVVAVLIPQKPWKAWFCGFLGLFLLWGGLSFYINMQNAGLLATKIATLLPLGGNAVLLILVTALIGALVASFAALTGSYLRRTKPTIKNM